MSVWCQYVRVLTTAARANKSPQRITWRLITAFVAHQGLHVTNMRYMSCCCYAGKRVSSLSLRYFQTTASVLAMYSLLTMNSFA